jgi:hypothetical protein
VFLLLYIYYISENNSGIMKKYLMGSLGTVAFIFIIVDCISGGILLNFVLGLVMAVGLILYAIWCIFEARKESKLSILNSELIPRKNNLITLRISPLVSYIFSTTYLLISIAYILWKSHLLSTL